MLLGSILMFFGVAAGAFGAHALSDYFEQYPKYAATFDTAVRYHMLHALGLFAVGAVIIRFPGNLATWAGWLLLIGVLIFSGSLYLLVFTRQSWLGAITPIGGVAMLLGWASLAIAIFRG